MVTEYICCGWVYMATSQVKFKCAVKDHVANFQMCFPQQRFNTLNK